MAGEPLPLQLCRLLQSQEHELWWVGNLALVGCAKSGLGCTPPCCGRGAATPATRRAAAAGALRVVNDDLVKVRWVGPCTETCPGDAATPACRAGGPLHTTPCPGRSAQGLALLAHLAPNPAGLPPPNHLPTPCPAPAHRSLQPKAGFGAHPHTNAEIFSYVVQASQPAAGHALAAGAALSLGTSARQCADRPQACCAQGPPRLPAAGLLACCRPNITPCTTEHRTCRAS